MRSTRRDDHVRHHSAACQSRFDVRIPLARYAWVLRDTVRYGAFILCQTRRSGPRSIAFWCDYAGDLDELERILSECTDIDVTEGRTRTALSRPYGNVANARPDTLFPRIRRGVLNVRTALRGTIATEG